MTQSYLHVTRFLRDEVNSDGSSPVMVRMTEDCYKTSTVERAWTVYIEALKICRSGPTYFFMDHNMRRLMIVDEAGRLFYPIEPRAMKVSVQNEKLRIVPRQVPVQDDTRPVREEEKKEEEEEEEKKNEESRDPFIGSMESPPERPMQAPLRSRTINTAEEQISRETSLRQNRPTRRLYQVKRQRLYHPHELKSDAPLSSKYKLNVPREHVRPEFTLDELWEMSIPDSLLNKTCGVCQQDFGTLDENGEVLYRVRVWDCKSTRRGTTPRMDHSVCNHCANTVIESRMMCVYCRTPFMECLAPPLGLNEDGICNRPVERRGEHYRPICEKHEFCLRHQEMYKNWSQCVVCASME